WQMRQIPIFRQRDGKDNLKKNEASYQKCYDLLEKNERILIFPEGDCVQEKRFRSVKKGTARMAFGAIAAKGWDIDLHIQPHTVNYAYPSKFRTDIILNIGAPIRLLDYKELYEQDEAKALTKLSRDIEKALKDIYIDIEDRRDLDVFEHLIEIERNNHTTSLLPWKSFDTGRFDMEKKLANKINASRVENEENHEKLIALAKEYNTGLKKLNINDRGFSKAAPNLILGYLTTIVLFPIFALGFILFAGQYFIADNIAKNKIKLLIFKNSIRLGITLALNLVLILIASITLAFFNPILGITLPFILTGIAWTSITYYEYVQRTIAHTRFIKMGKKKQRDMKMLFIQRKKLEKFIDA
ncbi:MAG: 1-acyl-sn-glycerol-3-phosphate acyltransferase, partial [Salibacteraceae bacterium]